MGNRQNCGYTKKGTNFFSSRNQKQGDRVKRRPKRNQKEQTGHFRISRGSSKRVSGFRNYSAIIFRSLQSASTPSEKKLDEYQEESVRNVYGTYFTASDEEDEEAKDAIFELKVSDSDTNPHLIPFKIASSAFTSHTLQLRDHLDRDREVTSTMMIKLFLT